MLQSANNHGLAIEVHDLCKSFNGVPAVIDTSLSVKKGEIFGFLGPNGSGKTTTIRMLCGLLTPDSGSGKCLGFDIVKDSQSIKSRVGYMTQRFSLYEELSIRENLEFIGRLYGVPRVKQKVTEALSGLGLQDRAHQLAGTLSGGWKQRLALAAALLHQPDLLLLDEPTAGVDPQARREFWNELHDLASTGITILVSTHYMDEAERCHRLAYILLGRILIQGTSAEIVKAKKLTTWSVSGDHLMQLASELKTLGIKQVTAFGDTLHVSDKNPEALASAKAKCQKTGQNWHLIESSLEDVFISLAT